MFMPCEMVNDYHAGATKLFSLSSKHFTTAHFIRMHAYVEAYMIIIALAKCLNVHFFLSHRNIIWTRTHKYNYIDNSKM